VKLSAHLELAIRRQIPHIQAAVSDGIAQLESELRDLGEGVPTNRGAMVYEVLRLCRIFEVRRRQRAPPWRGLMGAHGRESGRKKKPPFYLLLFTAIKR
jgi:hypothetical protein